MTIQGHLKTNKDDINVAFYLIKNNHIITNLENNIHFYK